MMKLRSWRRARRTAGSGSVFLFCIALLPFAAFGCAHVNAGPRDTATFREANEQFSRGNYRAALDKYEQIIVQHPDEADRALFEMGIIQAYPANEHKDYRKSLECFQTLVRDHPESWYRKDGEVMAVTIANVILKDETIAAQQRQVSDLRQELANRGAELASLQERITELERDLSRRTDEINRLQKDLDAVTLTGPADRILIEKGERRLTLFSKGRPIRTYRVALGGNPVGPKERQGDNRTPEGTYVIDARNRDSSYHLSLHISYPNEKDRKRARELGVSPGGDIMIHGIKNGLSWVGNLHAGIDWTKGCIAVTDGEIEEIDRLAPLGTVVEIIP